MASTSGMVPEISEKKRKSCKWRGCSTSIGFDSIEQVVEHVLGEHIPKVWKNEDGDEEVICEWDLCEMGTCRGDLERKTEWMQNHFKTRHAKSAKTFKCLFSNCDVVSATNKELEWHVRSVHLEKKIVEKRAKTESKEPTPSTLEPTPAPSSSDAPPLKRIWKVVNDQLAWEPIEKVTKKTIIHFADGPRYVFPAGCGRCNYDSDESELASDEQWEYVDYNDDEETIRKSWRPPKDAHTRPFYKYPSWYDPENPPETDSEEEARRRRPRRIKKKKPTIANKTAEKRGRLHNIIEKVQSKKESNSTSSSKSQISEADKWNASFWKKYLEEKNMQDKISEEFREISEPPALIIEPKESPRISFGDDEQMPILSAELEDVNNNDASFADSESEDVKNLDGLKEIPELIQEGEEEVEKVKETPKKNTTVRTPKSPKKQKPSESLDKIQKTPEDVKKRPSRSCRTNLSFYEIEEGIEAFEEILETKPVNFEPVKTLKANDTLNTTDSGIDTPKRKRGRPKKIETPTDDVVEEPPEKSLVVLKSPKSPKQQIHLDETPKRPSRACRVLGSMEEVPFDMEINVEFEKPFILKKSSQLEPPKKKQKVEH